MLSPKEFEELIAVLFSRFGFEVECTQQTHDGGKDIIAIKNDIVRLKYLIECKRYTPPKPIGIDVVQRLHGVTVAAGANKGIIATTTRITQPATNYMTETAPWLLEARDFEGIVDWLSLYQKFQFGKIV